MPKIQWTGLPAALRDHLFDRLRERKITAEDLYQRLGTARWQTAITDYEQSWVALDMVSTVVP